jgi:choline-sulfatase
MASSRRPNVLWIIADELRTDALSCYGHPTARLATPAIDRLAERGTTFLNFFCNSPICVSSRASMLTATEPEENTVYGNEGGWRSFPYVNRFRSFPERFAAAGYATANFGKSHVPPGLEPWQLNDQRGGTIVDFLDGCDPAAMDLVVTPTLGSPLGGVFPEDRPFPGCTVTDNALAWLARHGRSDQPFLLRLSYLQPHTPVTPPVAWRERWRDEPFPDLVGKPGTTSVFERALADAIRGDALGARERRRVQYEYYGLVGWLDDQVRRVLAALSDADLERDTIVVFTSDHGVSLGERGLFSKLVFAPQVHRIPGIVAWPGRLQGGVRRDDLAQPLDLARTLCGLCGIAPDDHCGGRDLFAADAPAHVFATVGFGHDGSLAFPNTRLGQWPDGSFWPRRACVRTRRWRLDMSVRKDGRPTGPAQEDIFLCDWLADPGESRNLAREPGLQPVVHALADLLRERAARAVEPAFIPAFSAAERGLH